VIAVLCEWYRDSSEARQIELRLALEANLANPRVSAVHVFGTYATLPSAPRHPKLVEHVLFQDRALFSALFSFAAIELPGQLCAIVNADIYFDETLAALDGVDVGDRVFALTRWDVSPAGLVFFDRADSQDAWIFRSPLPLPGASFPFGVLGCDNRLAWELQRAGRPVFNPSRTIHACHLHASAKRNYARDRVVPKPYLHVQPVRLEECHATDVARAD
jgi:hypothetical protein